MKLNIILLALFFSNLYVNAQDFDWALDFGDERPWIMTLTTNQDNNVYSAVGYTDAVDFDPGPEEVILVGGIEGGTAIQKLDHNGNLVWVKSFEFSGGDAIIGNDLKITAMSTDNSDNLYAIGTFTNEVDFDPGIGTEIKDTEIDPDNTFILKLDQDGNFIWVKTLGGLGTITDVSDLVIDHNGDVGITGGFYFTIDFNPGIDTYMLSAIGASLNTFVLKLTADGDFIWAKSIESAGDGEGNSLLSDEDGNFYIGGYFSGETDFDPGADSFVAETTAIKNGYLLKLNEFGDFLEVYLIQADSYTEISSIDMDTEENIYIGGLFSGENIDFNAGMEDELMTSYGETDIFILKISEVLDFIWVKQLGGEGYDKDPLLEISGTNSIYIGGNYTDDIDVDPSEDEFILTHDALESYANDFFFAHLTQDGLLNTGISYTGENNDIIYALESGNDGAIYLGGAVSSTIDLDHSIESDYIIEENELYIGFVVKLQDGISNIVKNSSVSAINLFPNPSHNHFEIQLDTNYEKVEVEIINSIGKRIQQETFTSVSNIPMKLDVDSGIYFVKVSINKKETLLKMVIH